MGERTHQRRIKPPYLTCAQPHTHTHTHARIQSPVWLMDVGALQLTLCCDKQQMFSNNVYRLGLHLQMTHTCFQSNRPREAIHPPCSGWPLHHCISPTMHEDGRGGSWHARIHFYVVSLVSESAWVPSQSGRELPAAEARPAHRV